MIASLFHKNLVKMQVHENNAPSEIILTHCGISMYAKCFIACGRMATLATVSKIGHFLDNNATSHIKCNVLIGICTYYQVCILISVRLWNFKDGGS